MRRSVQRSPLVFAALFAMIFSAAGSALSPNDLVHPIEQAPHLVLAWRDGHQLFPYDLRIMTREVESIFEAVGV